MFLRPALFTLTVARDDFNTPEQAYATIADAKCGFFRRLMRFLDVQLWVRVLEFQQKTGTGWPHWHFLIDLEDVPSHRIDLGKAWHLWRDKWGFGGVDLQARPNRFENAKHAIHYITKYLIKQPGMGYPLWLLEWRQTVRFFQASGKVGGVLLAARQSTDPREPKEDAEPRQRGERRTFADRMSHCKQSGIAFYEDTDPETGEKRRMYLGNIPTSPSRLAFFAGTGELIAPVEVETVTYDHENAKDNVVQPFLPAPTKADAEELLEKLRDELMRKGENERASAASTEKYRQLLEDNEFAKREQAEGVDDDIPF